MDDKTKAIIHKLSRVQWWLDKAKRKTRPQSMEAAKRAARMVRFLAEETLDLMGR